MSAGFVVKGNTNTVLVLCGVGAMQGQCKASGSDLLGVWSFEPHSSSVKGMNASDRVTTSHNANAKGGHEMGGNIQSNLRYANKSCKQCIHSYISD